MKKHRDYEDEMNEATKAKEVTAYEDSWYRSLKALADMRPTEAHAPEEERAAAEEIQPVAEEERAATDNEYASTDDEHATPEEQYGAAEDVHPPAEDVWHRPQEARPTQNDEETAGVPED